MSRGIRPETRRHVRPSERHRLHTAVLAGLSNTKWMALHTDDWLTRSTLPTVFWNVLLRKTAKLLQPDGKVVIFDGSLYSFESSLR